MFSEAAILLVLVVVGGIFLIIGRSVLRLALKVAFVMALVCTLIVGAGVGWWQGWFSSSSSTHRQVTQPTPRANTNRRPSR